MLFFCCCCWLIDEDNIRLASCIKHTETSSTSKYQGEFGFSCPDPFKKCNPTLYKQYWVHKLKVSVILVSFWEEASVSLNSLSCTFHSSHMKWSINALFLQASQLVLIKAARQVWLEAFWSLGSHCHLDKHMVNGETRLPIFTCVRADCWVYLVTVWEFFAQSVKLAHYIFFSVREYMIPYSLV